MIKPTIGRVVLFNHVDFEQRVPALICCVHSDNLINVAGFDGIGDPFKETAVYLCSNNETPQKRQAEWMDYQKKQSGQAEVSAIPAEHKKEALQFAEQCWCDANTSHIAMDPKLANAVAKRIASWMKTAGQFRRKADYFYGIVNRIGHDIGIRAFTDCDGKVSHKVLPDKVAAIIKEDYAKSSKKRFDPEEPLTFNSEEVSNNPTDDTMEIIGYDLSHLKAMLKSFILSAQLIPISPLQVLEIFDLIEKSPPSENNSESIKVKIHTFKTARKFFSEGKFEEAFNTLDEAHPDV